MPDTERTTADLLALLADNSTGEISEQDHRDVLVSMLGGYGSLLLAGGATPYTVNTAAAKFAAFIADGESSSDVTPDKDLDRITIGVTAYYRGSFYCTYLAPAGRTITFALAVNGVASTFFKCAGGGGTEPVTVQMAIPGTINGGDYIEIFWSADQNGTSVTPTNAVFELKRQG